HLVAQSDVHVNDAGRVSFLMVLDLRAGNAAGHLNRARAARNAGGMTTPFGLYHLHDSFRVEQLPPDPDIPDAMSKLVIVGFIPDNRPLPIQHVYLQPPPDDCTSGGAVFSQRSQMSVL
ncbi:MAG TPA: hypothetical protein VGW38_09070, partial [Chloroflexota bacterium]|nr:hypothetical protein [Chloroflexota bacterium]